MKPDGESHKVVVLYVDVSHLSRYQQLGVCSAVVLISSLLYGYYLELLMVNLKMGDHTWIVSGIQFAAYSGLAYLEALALRKHIGRRIPLKLLLLLGLASVITIGFSNNALKYLNYPTQVIFKSCKLIPVMIGGMFIMKKKYGAIDVLACVFMSIGLTFFTLVGSHLSPNFHHIGIFMMVMALTADAVIGNLQEKAMKGHGASSAEIMCSSFAVGAAFIFSYLLLTGELPESVAKVASEPELWIPITGLVLTGYVSVQNVLVLVKQFDALVAVTVTNLRKVLSLVLSFLAFTKPFSYHYVWSGILVVIGVYLNIFSKRLKSSQLPLLPTTVFEERIKPRSASEQPEETDSLVGQTSPDHPEDLDQEGELMPESGNAADRS